VLSDEEVAFLWGQLLELMLLICTLEKQVILRLLENTINTKPDMANVVRFKGLT
jgi:hypothetical protein